MLGVAYTASLMTGVVSGMIVGDALGAIPGKTTAPATSASSTPRATADGKPVSSTQTPRQSLFLSAVFVVSAIAILLLGSRALKDARIA